MDMKNMDEVVEAAQQAFFREVASHFPEIASGDFPPMAQMLFDVACRQAIETWVTTNFK